MTNYGWLLLWACLGVRNQYQRGMGPAECARHNRSYASTGVKYARLGELEDICRRHYGEVALVPHLWESSDRGHGTVAGALLCMPVVHRLVRAVYSRCVRVVLFLRK
jgi:hypothetical protein